MKLSNNSYFLIVIMLGMLVIIFSSLSLEFYASKLLPLFLGGTVFILSSIALRMAGRFNLMSAIFAS